MKNKDKNIVFIRLLNFTDEANKIVNKAIKISGDEKCDNVNAVCLFLALLENTRFGKNIIEYMGTTYDMIYDSFHELAENGVYGEFDSSNVEFTPEYFSKEVFMLAAVCSQKAFMLDKEVTPDMLINELMNMHIDLLEDFFDYIGLDIEDIDTIRNIDFSIPDELIDFVEDVHKSKDVLETTIKNVDNYTDEMIEILSRKKKANPCLIGEAGVGKTTIVNRLAQRINEKSVPDSLKDTHIVYINGATLASGTRYRGDFEDRMKSIMQWASSNNVILFLDEIHTFIKSGDTGHNDGSTAGNMIKKYLSDGSIRVIGATTLREYHTAIEKDKAFNRRLQKVVIKEPSVEQAIDMVKQTISDYERFHNVKISDNIIELAVRLSDRYVKDNFLPDKAYTVLDQAAAKTKLNGKKTVTEEVVLAVISKNTGVDINKIGSKEAKKLLYLEKTISKSLIGQANAVETVCKAIRRSKAGVREANKPLASFLFVGPTGVGKTELCKVLSKEVAMGEQPLIKIDMSEFSEKNSVSRLLGTTAGYIGYGEGGQLTEKVKHNPYSIILLDEIEKAHPDIFNTFLQLLDEGKLTDGEGTTVDFTNCIIVMTSNAGYGADGMSKGSLGFNSENKIKDSKEMEKIALKALEDTFKPEFLNRIDNIVIFEKLSKEQCEDITKLLLDKLSQRVKEKKISLTFDKSVISHITASGYSDKYGARNIKREIQDTVEDFIADKILSGKLKEGSNVQLVYKNNTLSIEEM